VLLSEPGRTQSDLFFTFFGIPVRIHPFFWLIAAIMGPWDAKWGGSPVIPLLMWVVVLLVSIFCHELGHALAMRWYGFRPRIILYAMGGLAVPEGGPVFGGRRSDTVRQVVISAAGPAAGFVVAAMVYALVWVAVGKPLEFEFGGRFGLSIFLPPIESEVMGNFVYWMMYVNLLWGLVNLLPVYPLDGGRIAGEIFRRFNPSDGTRQSLMLSVVTAVAVAGWFLVQAFRGEEVSLWDLYIPLLFGYLAYDSYNDLQSQSGRGRGW